jgi:hypothetical protein
LRWYADNSELHGTKDAAIPDILIFGGLILEREQENWLRAEVEKIKQAVCGSARAPFKWNMRSLEGLYSTQNVSHLYKKLFDNSQEIRRQIFSKIADCECVVMVSCVEGYSADRQVLKDKKDQLTGMVFANGLMRYALDVRDAKPLHADVVLDWPDKGKSRPFDAEYAAAYGAGKTADRAVVYNSGPLASLNFGDSLLYANMDHTTMLQVADMIVGAPREFIDLCLKEKKPTQGLSCIKQIAHRFRGAPGKILGYGIVPASGNKQLTASLKKGIGEHLAR